MAAPVEQQMPPETVTLAARVQRILFPKPGTGQRTDGFAIIATMPEDGDLLPPGARNLVVKGTFLDVRLDIGSLLHIQGTWLEDARWGRQVQVTMVSEVPFDSMEEGDAGVPGGDGRGLRKWLETREGIGEVTARRVFEALGSDALDRLNQDPTLVQTIPGLTDTQRSAVILAASAYADQRYRHRVIQWAMDHGLGTARANAVWKRFGKDAMLRLTADPYLLSQLDGVGFKVADEFAATFPEFPANAPARVRAAIEAVMETNQSEGHCFLSREQLTKATIRLLNDTPRTVLMADVAPHIHSIGKMPDGGRDSGEEAPKPWWAHRMRLEQDRIYPARLFVAEQSVARCVNRLLGRGANV